MRVRSSRRRGGTALVALVCLGLIGVVMAALLRSAYDRAEQLRSIERGLQSRWLVEAGLERAAARLEADAEYRGETWAIPAERLGGRAATVVIEVGPPGEAGADARGVPVRIRADFPSDGGPAGRARRARAFWIRPGAGIERGEG